MELREPAETAVLQCTELTADESCVIVTDDERRAIGDALYEVAAETTDDAVIARYPPGAQHGEEPPSPVAEAMRAADVVLAPTTKSITHTRARTEATDAGTRVITMPGITEEIFVEGVTADYARIKEVSDAVHEQVVDAREIRVTSPEGTDVTVRPGDRKWLKDMGLVPKPGYLSNLPAGEVFVSPVSADGEVVVDGSMAPHGLLTDGTVSFSVTDGFVTDIADERLREAVEDAASEVGEAAYNLAEFGIGTNLGVRELMGSILLDEKAGGTVHFAIGDDSGIGGDTEAPIHLDGVLRNPTVYADGTEIDLPG